jgi:hypothetical protein
MGFTRANKNPNCTNVAAFKAWAQWMGDEIVNRGWVRTGDTGQADWPNIVAVPSAAGTVWEVFRANDSLQATMPMFLYLSYYATTNSPRLQVMLGIGTNGAGSLIYPCLSANSLPAGASADDNPRDCVICGDAGFLTVLMFRDASDPNTFTFAFCVDRSRDETGAPTDEYIGGWAFGNNGHRWHANCPKPGTGTKTAWSTDIGVCSLAFVGQTANWNFQGNVAISPIFPAPGFLGNPTLGIVCCREADANENEQKTVNIYGANHNYLFSKATSVKSWAGSGTTSAFGVLME